MTVNVLSLYVEKDSVWKTDIASAPVNTGMTPAEFVKKDLSGVDKIRMLGFSSNAALICELYDKHLVELATPTMCDYADLKSPDVVLYRMQHCCMPSALGGWHTATATDAATYRLHLCRNESELVHVFRQHPLYQRLSFIGTLVEVEAARVLSYLLDPRWFARPRSPSSLTAAYAYMGIDPVMFKMRRLIASGVSIKNSPSTERKIIRLHSAVAAWDGDMSDEAVDVGDPKNFLYTKAYNIRNDTQMLCRRTRAFITYLMRNWYSVINDNGHADEHFLPDLYFKQASVANEFRRFINGSVD